MAVDGKWNITVKSELNLKTDGDKLTGTASGAQGSNEIANGKVDGDNVSWSADIKQPFPMTLEFAGKVDGDAISGNVKAGSFGSFPFTGNRA